VVSYVPSGYSRKEILSLSDVFGLALIRTSITDVGLRLESTVRDSALRPQGGESKAGK
jgi:hypothetical protein